MLLLVCSWYSCISAKSPISFPWLWGTGPWLWHPRGHAFWIPVDSGKVWKWKCELLSHLWLCDAMYCSPPGSSVHGILQARILEWVAISLSRASSRPGIEPGSPALQAGSLVSEPPGKPWKSILNRKSEIPTVRRLLRLREVNFR